MSKFVICPDNFEPLFQMAEDILVPVFENRKWDPDRGSTLVTGERYVMYRGASIAVALKSQLEQVLGSGSGTLICQARGDAQCRFVMTPPARPRERVQESSLKYNIC